MPIISFFLDIDAAEVQKYYRGEALSILATSHNGLRVQFPANLILPYVAHNGVQGEFSLEYREDGKAISLSKL